MKTTTQFFLFMALAFVISAPVLGQAATGGETLRPQNPGQASLATEQIRTQNLTRSAEFFNILRNKRVVDKNGLPTVGSVYINENFRPCQVYYKDELQGEYLYRHNAFNDEIEIRSMNPVDTTTSSLLINRNVWFHDRATNKEVRVMTFLNEEEVLRNGYLYPIINEGNYQLFYKNQVKFTEGAPATNSFVRPTPNRFTHFKRYFLKTADKNMAFQLEKRKSSFIRHLPKEVKEKAKAFMKENKISVKDEQDLIELITFLNQLTQS